MEYSPFSFLNPLKIYFTCVLVSKQPCQSALLLSRFFSVRGKTVLYLSDSSVFSFLLLIFRFGCYESGDQLLSLLLARKLRQCISQN